MKQEYKISTQCIDTNLYCTLYNSLHTISRSIFIYIQSVIIKDMKNMPASVRVDFHDVYEG